MSQRTKADKDRTAGSRIEDVAQRALDLREMAFEIGDPSLIKAIDLMMYCIGKAVARERRPEPAGVPAPVLRLGGETPVAPAGPKRRRAVRTVALTSEAA